MKGKLGLSSLVLILSAAGAATAQTQTAAQATAPKAGVAAPNPRAAHFDALDINKDGKLTRDEFQAEHNRLWQQADANHDGYVTLQEAESAATKLRAEFVAKRFAELDVNHDNKVSTDEAGRMPAWRFQKIDSNSDGVLSLDEMQKAPLGKFGGPRGHHGDNTASDEHHEAANAEQREKFVDQVFKKVDANQDGKVTLAEIQAQPSGFERLDSNHDGNVTREEFQQQPWFGRGGHNRGHGPGADAPPNAKK